MAPTAVETSTRRFLVVLIKPSHYDGDGYVIQWHRSGIPSNSLASVYGAFAECASAHALGPDVKIELEGYDECNTVIDVRGIVKRLRKAGQGLIGLVGVQSNQFPRALDLARQFRASGLPVVIGGFHVSGCISMLPELPPDLDEALELGVTLYAGEAEGRLHELLQDIDRGSPKRVYNHLHDLPGLEGASLPILPRDICERVYMRSSTFDAGRGCPFQCSFCTIINVQGRKSRYRTADDVEAIVRANAAQGITRFFVTDDDFARNKNWESILDRLADLRVRQGFGISLVLQVDTLSYRIPGFIEKAARAGCRSVFIGLENINPESLMAAKKRQNKIWEYREMLLAWRRFRISTHAGYILGFPADTPQSIARDIEIIKKELPVDLLEFFYLTPLPGSEDHKKLYVSGTRLEPDLNKYDLEHPCTDHPRMSQEEWTQAYNDAWERYYSRDHIETILRRAAASVVGLGKVANGATIFSGATSIEGLHPLQCGIGRRKVRTQRRAGYPIENPFTFYPRRAVEITFEWSRWGWRFWWIRRLRKRIAADPASSRYSDEALIETPVTDSIVETYASKVPKTHGAPVRQPAA
ncbi:B12-binding domain-containing radical SAM protein [Rhodoplanes sp. Z2-YC6860]|uniref:B12-binding domain-containing radical SAM protein n=1 Tax=Rhodoplanes sp. Z2-YC6860 TaxID=674703 RepID=UPI00078C02F7|nr:radical SAM protein [Rhodoplanes sp. Z2-YC6860]AMN42004.1 radical SAM family protein [Rhodoplanes sp. Z2-YC6860]